MAQFSKGMFTFYTRLYETVEDPSLDSIISWSESNKSFIIWDQKELIRRRLLRRFYCISFTRFLIELENFGFVRMNGSESEPLEFGHKKYFVRGQPERLKTMHLTSVTKRWKKESKAIKAKAKAVKEVEGRMQQVQI